MIAYKVGDVNTSISVNLFVCDALTRRKIAFMTEDAKKTRGGSKLSRSEITTVRLDPKLRYLAEIAARKHRRTLSSYVEWAVESSLRDVKIYEGTGYNGDDSISVAEEASTLWDVDESERFIRLAIAYPSLMTHEEQERWKMLSDSDLLGPAKKRARNGSIEWDRAKLEDVVFPTVRRHWPLLIHAHSEGAEGQQAWVRMMRQKVQEREIFADYPPKKSSASAFDEMDDKLPF